MIEASHFYEAASPGLEADFLDDVQRVIDMLCEQPKLGRSVSPALRRAVFPRFPFSIIYAEEGSAILIVAVAHQKRRPGYWRVRADR